MMKSAFSLLILFIAICNSTILSAPQDSTGLRVTAYHAKLHPHIESASIEGSVIVHYLNAGQIDVAELALQKGRLEIDSAFCLGGKVSFRVDSQLVVFSIEQCKGGEDGSITLYYHGTPKSGLIFAPKDSVLYTCFSTSQWMPCVDAPSQKAQFHLELIVPANYQCVANGKHLGEKFLGDDVRCSEWLQDMPISTYTFGFAAGKLVEAIDSSSHVRLRCLSVNTDAAVIKNILAETKAAVAYFEWYSGISYPGDTYTQVFVPGSIAQEMVNFSVIGEEYVKDFVTDHDFGMFTHELAHEWWGNMVTCVDWRHFWLNEGMATWMVAKYKGHKAGKAFDEEEINDIIKGYQSVVEKGKDKPVEFPDWNHPTREDRRIVYDKGAYVFHSLEQELGAEPLRLGLQKYTKEYFGKSVVSRDLEEELEKSSGKNLKEFFMKWVYLVK